jgi:hypothetical protein
VGFPTTTAEKVFAQMAAQIPLGRLGRPDEIINGANIQVDGGWAQI